MRELTDLYRFARFTALGSNNKSPKSNNNEVFAKFILKLNLEIWLPLP